MWLSKLWFTLVAFAAGCGIAFGLLVFSVSTRGLEREQAERLDRAQDNAHLLLKLNIRSWIDEAARLSADAMLSDAAEGFARAGGPQGGGDAALVHRNAKSRLEAINEKLKADALVLADANGKVVARAGFDAKSWGDGLLGYPLVEQVLRGYRRDDTWGMGGQLYRMAGSPIPSRGRDRFVGALLVGKRVNDEFARSLSTRLGTDVIFYLSGKVVGRSLGSTVMFALPSLIEANRDVLRKDGRTPALSVAGGGTSYRVVLAPVVGEAADQDACYALLIERAVPTGIGALLQRIGRDDVAFGNFPWGIVGGGLLGALVLGLLLMTLEVDRPLRRLLDESRDVARGVSGKVNDTALRGRFGSIGRAINETIERLGKAAPGKRDIGAILGTQEMGPMGRVPSVGVGQPTTSAGSRMSTTGPMRAVIPGQTPPMSFAAPGGIRPLAPPIAAAPTPPLLDDPSLLMEEAAADDGEAALDPYLRQVHKEFSDLKRRCGETDAVGFERFAEKLRENRRQMIERFGCKDVKFVVYVKDGKAAVKASPVKA